MEPTAARERILLLDVLRPVIQEILQLPDLRASMLPRWAYQSLTMLLMHFLTI